MTTLVADDGAGPEGLQGAPKVQVRLEGVTKLFSHPRTSSETVAVQDLDFHVSKGEMVSLLGPSGCGKSTVLNMIAGFESPTRGRALVEDKPISGPGPDRGVVFQDLYLFDWLTVEENIGFPLKMRATSVLAATGRRPSTWR